MKKKIAIYHNLPSGGGLKTIEEFLKRMSGKYDLDFYGVGEKDETNRIDKYFKAKYIYKFKRLSLIKGGPLLRLQEDYNLFKNYLSLQRKIAEDINLKNYDLVILSHDIYMQAPFLARFLTSKILYYCQEPWRIYYEYSLNSLNRKKFNLKKVFLMLSDYCRKAHDIINVKKMSVVLVNSYSSMESFYRAYGSYAVVCHLGVDFDIFKPIKINKENYVYCVGNLSIHKGHEFVIDSIALIAAKEERPTLYISSGGIDLIRKDYLEKYAARKHVKIRIYSRISEAEIVALYNKAKIVVCAAHLETLGLSAIEAMACGTPVIAVREGGYRDMVIDGVNGLFIERDEKQLAKAIKLLSTDHVLYSTIAKQTRKSIYPYWSWEFATKRLEKQIDIVLNKK